MSAERATRTGGLLLTGGGSRRMGTAKAALVVDGLTLAARTERLLTAVADPVIEVGPGWTSLPAVSEDPPGAGPLAAVVAGAAELRRRAPGRPALVVAVDLPRLTAGLLGYLAGHPASGSVVPVVGGMPQPLCARWSPLALARAAREWQSGARSVRAVFAGGDVTWVDEAAWGPPAGDPEALDDADTPAELVRLVGR